MPVSPSLLSPCPSCSSSLSSTTSLDVFVPHVDKRYHVDEIRNDLLPLVCGAQKSKFKSPSNNGLQFGGHLAQAARRSSTPIVSAGGMYALITKNQSTPVMSWEVRMFREAMCAASTKKP